MRSLALLIAAAAGINAMLGAEVNAVVLPGSRYLCADNCQEQGILFGQEGTCWESEAVVRTKVDGTDEFDIVNESFTCPRNKHLNGQPAWRERNQTEAPPPCEIKPFTDREKLGCMSNKIVAPGEPSVPDITLDMEEVKQRLGDSASPSASPSAPGQQPTPAPEKPAQTKLDKQCKSEASKKVQLCTSRGVPFLDCDKAAQEWIKRCKAGRT
ncbi:hypothetical protein IF1G_04380 [Cordyceps javanica]|uniref:Uncharacterized protein n=1 Tax=Cordyceps javanica TaxID=43265 RepID=A0A545W323_9HYPO|nr:hypothetical protein IF1G_04380 [Cordyceps javanica]TQW08382.1 hypothetical protein IF2G_04258 [Cordyceps javanica]